MQSNIPYNPQPMPQYPQYPGGTGAGFPQQGSPQFGGGTFQQPYQPQSRSGFKTTEFWVTVGTMLVSFAYMFGYIEYHQKQSLGFGLEQVANTVVVVGGNLFNTARYIKSRKEIKQTQIEATADIVKTQIQVNSGQPTVKRELPKRLRERYGL